MQLNLYRRSYPSQKVLCAVTLLGIPLEVRDIDLMSESSWPVVERLSYWGRLPVLRTETEAVCESANIVEYLAIEAGAARELFGESAHTQRRARHLSSVADLYLGAVVGRYFHHVVGWAPLSSDRVSELMRDAGRALAFLSEELAGRDWLLADHPTAPDLCWLPAALAATRQLEVSSAPNITRYLERGLTTGAFAWLSDAREVGFPSFRSANEH